MNTVPLKFVHIFLSTVLVIGLLPILPTVQNAAYADEVASGSNNKTEELIIVYDDKSVDLKKPLQVDKKELSTDAQELLDDVDLPTLQDLGVKEQDDLSTDSIDGITISKLELKDSMLSEEVEEVLSAVEGVSFVQPNYCYEPLSLPNDPYLQKDHADYQYYASASGATSAWTEFDKNVDLDGLIPGENVSVAVLDTGVNANHEDLQAVVDVTHGYDVANSSPLNTNSDSNGHGTLVSGVIAAEANNGKGIAGVSYGAKIVPVKVFNSEDICTTADLLKAYSYLEELITTNAVPNLKVVNMSLGYYAQDLQDSDKALQNIIALMRDKYGVLTVCASGNSGKSTQCFPASFDESLSVGALDKDDTVASFSRNNFGQNIYASGVDIVSTNHNGGYSILSGTSMASPQVAAAAAVLWSVNRDLTVDEVVDLLQNNAKEVSENTNNSSSNKKGLDLNAALSSLVGGNDIESVDEANSDKVDSVVSSGFPNIQEDSVESKNDKPTSGFDTDLQINDKDPNQEVTNEDPANSWRYENGQKITVAPEATTGDSKDLIISPLAAVEGGASYATWYKTNGATSYTWKAKPTDAGTIIKVPGSKRIGIDVSAYQGKIDWAKVKADGVSFAIIRCASRLGSTHVIDSQFINNVKGAQANGIDIGVYIYSYAQNITGVQSSKTEADNVLKFLQQAGLNPSKMRLPVYYDLEDKSQVGFGSVKLGQMAKTFCDTIASKGYSVGIYANQNWWRNYLTDPVFKNSNWHKWAARYPGGNKATDSGVNGTEIWQFTDCGRVSGISGNVDMNFDYGTSVIHIPESALVTYTAHVKNLGWLSTQYDGKTAGTTGRSLTMEALQIGLNNQKYSGSIQYRSHVQNVGWEQQWTTSGSATGSTGQSRRMEAIQIVLTGQMAEKYDVYYRTHVSNIGWLGWAKNGEASGSSGYSYGIEALEIKLVAKNGKAPGSTSDIYRIKNALVSYATNGKSVGWQKTQYDGATSGSIGSSRPIEAVKLSLNSQKYSGSLVYRSHLSNSGWESNWTTANAQSGVSGKSIEAIQIDLTGQMANKYDVYYRVHAKNIGWMGWAKNGAIAGTMGYSYPIEAIEIQLVVKNGKAPGATQNYQQIKDQQIAYQAHVQNVGTQTYQYSGSGAGTTGRSLRCEAVKIKLLNPKYSGGIQYRSHVQNIGWEQGWKTDDSLSGTSGRSLRLEAIQIQLTGDMAKNYDVCYRVHVSDFGWMGWAKNGASAGSEGFSKRIEAIEIQLLPKGAPLPGSSFNSFRKK